jgi:hypothetical protein
LEKFLAPSSWEDEHKNPRELEEKTDANQPNREKNRGSTQGDEEKMKTGN